MVTWSATKVHDLIPRQRMRWTDDEFVELEAIEADWVSVHLTVVAVDGPHDVELPPDSVIDVVIEVPDRS